MGESSFDELHGSFDCHTVAYGEQQMEVVGHDDEVVEFQLALCDKGTKDVDEELCVALGLQDAAAHAGARRREEGSRRIEDAGWGGISGRMRHGRG